MVRTSLVWHHFNVSPSDESIAVCKHCQASISRGGTTSKTFSTTNLMRHLNKKHRDELLTTAAENDAVSVDKPPTSSAGCQAKQATLQSFMEKKKLYDINDKRALAISQLIGRMIVTDLQPFSVVEDRGFKDLMSHLDPRYQMPSRKYFSETVIPGMYDQCRNKITELMDIQDFVSLTTDIWTSRAKDGYISLTGHFIDSDWERKAVVFGVREFNDRHTASNIADALKEMVDEWDIEYKILACTRDNGANIVAALDILDVLAIPCLAHTLQLVVQNESSSRCHLHCSENCGPL